jgi:integrase
MSKHQKVKAAGFGIYKDGRSFRLQVTGKDGKRRVLRLRSFGIKRKRDADEVAARMESLLAIRDCAAVPDEGTLSAIRELHPRIRDFLDGAGLIPREAEERTVHQCMDAFLAVKRGQCKASSMQVLGRAARHAKAHFSSTKTLQSVASADVESFCNWLKQQPGKQSPQLAEATIRKTCSVLCQMFRFARRNEWVRNNPVLESEVKRSAAENEDRVYFVSIQETKALLAACDSREERLLIGFARFAALRIPSEIRELRWSDFDKELRVFKVYAPKTGRFRSVPVMKHLHDLLLEADIPLDRSDYVFPRLRLYPSLSTAMRRIIRNAGITDYPRALHSLRGSCISEWVETHKSIPEVASWAGHSIPVMTRHYLRRQSLESALRAADLSRAEAQKPDEGGAESVRAA